MSLMKSSPAARRNLAVARKSRALATLSPVAQALNRVAAKRLFRVLLALAKMKALVAL